MLTPRIFLTLAGGLGFASMVHAALPPQYQNLKDLEVMVAFVAQYPAVAGSIRSIDMWEHVVHFGEGCRAEFARQEVNHPQGWAGPQGPLVFSRSNCRLDQV